MSEEREFDDIRDPVVTTRKGKFGAYSAFQVAVGRKLCTIEY